MEHWLLPLKISPFKAHAQRCRQPTVKSLTQNYLGMEWCENIGKEKIWIYLVWFFSSHSTSLNVATSEIWLFMAWNCTTAETSKLTEEGNGQSAPDKNSTTPVSCQEDSAIPVQLGFPSPVTLYTFRWPQKEPISLLPCNELYSMDTTTMIC